MKRQGFTLIELLIVVVVIGILASIAIVGYNGVRKRSFYASVESDLRNVLVKQEMYHTENFTYASTLAAIAHNGSPGVNITIAGSSNTGWAATATHDAYTDIQCGVYVGADYAGDAGPATLPERVTCND